MSLHKKVVLNLYTTSLHSFRIVCKHHGRNVEIGSTLKLMMSEKIKYRDVYLNTCRKKEADTR